ncbi:hypothetical protein PT974_12549 [Cladobotryum mycophilum]|uniref:N-acetyltransferase domain-containing protein n=1 Tax=Cladobotryum mycophilum TaxID=491253 RepID=A0ABR0S9E3_9HYPO
MPLTLAEADLDKDFDELMLCNWQSFENPSQNFFRLFAPIHGTGPTAREDVQRDFTQRQLAFHKMDPRGTWFKAVNDDGKIVGGALWKIFPTNPFEQPPPGNFQAFWYPEGGQRDFVTAALHRINAFRSKAATRPHVFLNIIYTHPDHRRQGVGRLMIEWGIKKADELGIETWVNSTGPGVPLYQEYGFVVVNETTLCPETENPNEEWKEMAERFSPMDQWVMWRPVGGKYEEGKTVRPWE